MRRTNLRGHALLGEGAAYEFDHEHRLIRVGWMSAAGTGIGRCQCGAFSGVLQSAAARKRWHAQHKEDERHG